MWASWEVGSGAGRRQRRTARRRLHAVVQLHVGHQPVVRRGGARRQLVARVARQPRVPQHVARAQPLARLAPQQRPDQALAPRRQALRHHEVTPGYFCK